MYKSFVACWMFGRDRQCGPTSIACGIFTFHPKRASSWASSVLRGCEGSPAPRLEAGAPGSRTGSQMRDWVLPNVAPRKNNNRLIYATIFTFDE